MTLEEEEWYFQSEDGIPDESCLSLIFVHLGPLSIEEFLEGSKAIIEKYWRTISDSGVYEESVISNIENRFVGREFYHVGSVLNTTLLNVYKYDDKWKIEGMGEESEQPKIEVYGISGSPGKGLIFVEIETKFGFVRWYDAHVLTSQFVKFIRIRMDFGEKNERDVRRAKAVSEKVSNDVMKEEFSARNDMLRIKIEEEFLSRQKKKFSHS